MSLIKILVNYTCSRQFHSSIKSLAGHSKWANIKHTKAAKDAQKSLQFTKLGRQIRLAVQNGGGSTNPELNTMLKSAIEEAIKKNMPQASINNILKKFNDQKSLPLHKYLLEMQLMQQIFVVCSLYTDNFPSVKMNVNAIIKKYNGAITNTQHLFDKTGVIEAIAPHTSSDDKELEENCTEDAILCGADDLCVVDSIAKRINFLCDADNLLAIRTELQQRGYSIENAEQMYFPKNPITLGENEISKYELIKEKLMAVDGVEDIYDNVN